MSYPNVRRLTATVALALVLAAAAPALAAPGNHLHATQAPAVTGLPLLDRLLDWLGFPAARDLPDLRGTHEESTTVGVPVSPGGTVDAKQPPALSRGGMIDPNG
ncbi:MAG: hypothetical protein JF614_23530 [Acidobacteria bacterium]|nr:hypothetical protein [Acidobacteriota bacterium]